MNPKQGHIVCAVRGGPDCRDTGTRAIELALEMVMGQPMRSPGRNLFNAAEFEAFVDELEREGNLHVVQVTPSADAERTDFISCEGLFRL